jgi:hypothetical protein
LGARAAGGTSADLPELAGQMHFHRQEGMLDPLLDRIAYLSEGTGMQVLVPEEPDSYRWALEFLVLEGVLNRNGVPARHMFWSSGGTYGAKYKNLFTSLSHMSYDYATRAARPSDAARDALPVFLRPTSAYTKKDEELAKATMANCVPIPPNRAPVAWWSKAESAELGLRDPQGVERGDVAIDVLKKAFVWAGIHLAPWSEDSSDLPSATVTSADLQNLRFCKNLCREIRAGMQDHPEKGLQVCVRAECVNPGLWEAHIKFFKTHLIKQAEPSA